MKKVLTLPAFLLLLSGILSFRPDDGGDLIEIYLNGSLVQQQFVHAEHSIRTISLTRNGGKDKVEILYSHCGQAGKKRVLTFRNEKNEPIKILTFADERSNRSKMQFLTSDIPLTESGYVKLFYSSKELPEGRILVNFDRRKNKLAARTVSL